MSYPEREAKLGDKCVRKFRRGREIVPAQLGPALGIELEHGVLISADFHSLEITIQGGPVDRFILLQVATVP